MRTIYIVGQTSQMRHWVAVQVAHYWISLLIADLSGICPALQVTPFNI
jgi:hypothetical protein